MHWIIGGIAALALVGAIWGAVAFGTVSSPQVEDDQPGEQGRSIAQMREEQRLGNTLFEVVPGEVRESDHPDGRRYAIRVRATNLDQTRTLQGKFWEVSATGVLGEERHIDVEAYIPEWSGLRDVPPEGSADNGTILVIAPQKVDALEVTVTYREPGRTESEASFVWPYGG